MKLVFISDTHGKHSELKVPMGDVLIHSGDVSMHGGPEAYKNFSNWFNSLPHLYKIVIAGNHDLSTSVLLPMLNSDVIYLQDSEVSIDGVKFYGSPYTPRFGLWAWMENRGEPLRAIWNKIPTDTDVLITHGPPHRLLDYTIGGEHAGCEDLRARVLLVQPKLHCFGHIHEGYGVGRCFDIPQTEFINASVVNEDYNVVNAPIVREI